MPTKSVSPNRTLPLPRIFRPTTIPRRITHLAPQVAEIAPAKVTAVAAIAAAVIAAVTVAAAGDGAVGVDGIAGDARKGKALMGLM